MSGRSEGGASEKGTAITISREVAARFAELVKTLTGTALHAGAKWQTESSYLSWKITLEPRKLRGKWVLHRALFSSFV